MHSDTLLVRNEKGYIILDIGGFQVHLEPKGGEQLIDRLIRELENVRKTESGS